MSMERRQIKRIKGKSKKNSGIFYDKKYFHLSCREALITTSLFMGVMAVWAAISQGVIYANTVGLGQDKPIKSNIGWSYLVVAAIAIYIIVRARTVIILNVLEEQQKEDEENKRKIEKVFREAPVIIATWDKMGQIKKLNPYGQKILGYTEEEIINKKWVDILVSEDERPQMRKDIERIKHTKVLGKHNSSFITKNKSKVDIIWNSSFVSNSDRTEEILSIGTDITGQRKYEEKLKKIAYFDDLTGLPNQASIENEINRLIEEEAVFSFVHLNLDNSRQINNIAGHAVGDRYLQFFANKLSECIIAPHKIARLKGDEFAIALVNIETREEIEAVLMKLRQSIGRSWEMNGHEFFVSASTGIATFPKDGPNFKSLFKQCNIALYKAKKDGKDKAVFYSEKILVENIENTKLAKELQHAVENKELVLYYQPQFDIQTGKIKGLEALVRWIHPENGFIPPSKFIPLAEETGQIFEIERWIFETALIQKKMFEQEGKHDISISINLSSKSLSSEINFKGIEQLFSQYDIDYSQVTVEITETAIISDVGFAVERLQRLRKIGMKIALDDFGTGYSSLMHLKDFPIDIVKLDQNFTRCIEEASKAAMIIKAILYLTRDLNYEVVAEGIETNEQLAYLKKYKCKTGQGFLMSRPIPIESVAEKLKCGF